MDIDGGLASLRMRARWAQVFLAINIAFMLANLAHALFKTVTSAPPVYVNVPNPTPSTAEFIIGLSGLAWMALNLVLPVLVLLWVYQAHANLHRLRLRGLNYGPGWAVGSFFVPFVNLVVPYRAMRELCNRSFGESEYQAHEPVGDVSSWWTCLIVGGAIQLFLITALLIEAATPIFFTTPQLANRILGLFSISLLTGSAFFLFRIIGSVTEAQQSVTGTDGVFA